MAQERRIFDRLRVFVSSRMEELREERKAVRAALDALKVEAWVFGLRWIPSPDARMGR